MHGASRSSYCRSVLNTIRQYGGDGDVFARCEPHCAVALLSATGSQLTKLDSYTIDASQPLLMDAIAKLSNLHNLKLCHNDYNEITTNFRSMKVCCPILCTGRREHYHCLCVLHMITEHMCNNITASLQC